MAPMKKLCKITLLEIERQCQFVFTEIWLSWRFYLVYRSEQLAQQGAEKRWPLQLKSGNAVYLTETFVCKTNPRGNYSVSEILKQGREIE